MSRGRGPATPGSASRSLLLALGVAIPVALIAGVFAIALQGKDPGNALLHTERVEVPPDGGWPRRAISVGGRVNLITNRPRRIVIANTTGVDMVTALVEPNRIAALCDQAFQWSLLARDEHAELASRLADEPRFTEISAENVLQHAPDLILVAAYNDPETVALLTEAGTPVLCLPYPTTVDGVFANFGMLGRALGEEERAAALVASLRARLDALRTGDPGAPRPKAMFYSNLGGGGSTMGRGTLADSVLEAAGCVNAAEELGLSGFADVSLEEIAGIAPDLFVVGTDGETGRATSRQVLEASPVADAVPAVAAGRFVELHPSLYSTTSQEIVVVAERIAASVADLRERAPGKQQDSGSVAPGKRAPGKR